MLGLSKCCVSMVLFSSFEWFAGGCPHSEAAWRRGIPPSLSLPRYSAFFISMVPLSIYALLSFASLFRENLKYLSHFGSKRLQLSHNMSTLLFSLFNLHVVTAAPFQNQTESQVAPTRVSDPSGRGSSDILYSCASTLVLCV